MQAWLLETILDQMVPSLQIDSLEGTKSTIDFDFESFIAVNENFKLVFHFQQPFLNIYWEFLEF